MVALGISDFALATTARRYLTFRRKAPELSLEVQEEADKHQNNALLAVISEKARESNILSEEDKEIGASAEKINMLDDSGGVSANKATGDDESKSPFPDRTQRACRNDELEFFFKDLGFASNFKLEKLSYVSVYVNGLTLEVEFLKYLLESSLVLEKMNVELRDDTEEKKKDLRAKLEGCNLASSIVKLCYQTMTTSNRTLAAFLSAANW